ncbi:Xaa-Pro peptidase family protein [Bordetella sp. N]|uniref:M24 family metallopeptidase n=1 Tax=Bordetella sp. N TaxID=1746199 RepID=UPI0007102CD8|nr:Xaa-Pro peptidase family protein [Bordetella sp. N]ALM81840.1 creatininase [Bordetella sp. N]
MNQTKHLLFTQHEYDERVARVREQMRARQIDVLLIDQTEFLAYITGFSISENMYRCCLLPLEGDPVMMLRAVDLGPFLESSWVTDAVAFSDWEDPIDVLGATVEARGWSRVRVGLDEDSYCMPLRRYKQLAARLPQVAFVDFSGVLERLRMCKSAAEIAYLREASRIGDLAIDAVLATTGVGRSERDAAAVVHEVFMSNGADTSRAGIITAGIGDSFLHGNLHGTPMKAGDVLHLELLPLVNGYSARIMRPVVIGPAGERAALARQLVEIQDRQFAAMAPGRKASDIDAIVRDGILAAGLRPDYRNITGYTIGHFPLSTPHTSDFSRIFLPNSQWELEPGMVFHMYVSAAGVAFSETVLVTETGVECLTKSPRKLFEV